MAVNGFGPQFTYNPYGNPYAAGIPSGAFMQPYGFGGFGNQFGMPFGNPYGGYNTFQTNNPAVSYNTGFNGAVPGYGFDSAVAPTVFQTPVSGNGQLTVLNPARGEQDSYALQTGNNWGRQGAFMGSAIGAGLTATALTVLGSTIGRIGNGALNRLVGAKGALLLMGIGTVAGGLIGNQHGERLGQTWGSQTYVGLDYADNGHLGDNSYYVQRNGQFM